MDKFKTSSYILEYEKVDFKDLTREDIVNGEYILLQMGRGGIEVYKIMILYDAYVNYGYLWIRDRCAEDHIIINPKKAE